MTLSAQKVTNTPDYCFKRFKHDKQLNTSCEKTEVLNERIIN